MADDDILKDYPVEQVHRWYNRLADAALARKIQGKDPLSGQFLKTYVTNKLKDKIYKFSAPDYLQNYSTVKSELMYHRKVFLTEQKARLGKNGATKKWAGLVPRLKDGRWDGKSEIELYYESLVSIGPNRAEVARIQMFGTEQEQDLFTSLRGFQMRSDIKVTGSPKGNLVTVKFDSWTVTGHDRYDFNYDEYLTLPNPDYSSEDDDAIRPDLQSFRIYHTNAKRMVDKGLAAPFKVEIGPWKIITQEVIKDGLIDPNKNI